MLTTDQGVIYKSANLETSFDTTAYSVFEDLGWTLGYFNDTFVPVKIGDYRYGFVKWNSFRSPIEYRGNFIRKSNRWKLKQFIAGD